MYLSVDMSLLQPSATLSEIQACRPHQRGSGAGHRDERHGAICLSRVIPGGLAAAAQQAVEANMRHRPMPTGRRLTRPRHLRTWWAALRRCSRRTRWPPGRTPTRWQPPRRRTIRAD
uniref:Uncharacterized protein n=1 Tax=Oryza meridionalis TaxID=40149 RepID=A0A0E0EIS2_9ORYZ